MEKYEEVVAVQRVQCMRVGPHRLSIVAHRLRLCRTPSQPLVMVWLRFYREPRRMSLQVCANPTTASEIVIDSSSSLLLLMLIDVDVLIQGRM
jgi:hypothetical protein